MTDRQLKFILYFATGYLLGNILAWGAFGVYLLLTGRA